MRKLLESLSLLESNLDAYGEFQQGAAQKLTQDFPRQIEDYVKKFYGEKIDVFYKISKKGSGYVVDYASRELRTSSKLMNAVMPDAAIVVQFSFSKPETEDHSKKESDIGLEFRPNEGGRPGKPVRSLLGNMTFRF